MQVVNLKSPGGLDQLKLHEVEGPGEPGLGVELWHERGGPPGGGVDQRGRVHHAARYGQLLGEAAVGQPEHGLHLRHDLHHEHAEESGKPLGTTRGHT